MATFQTSLEKEKAAGKPMRQATATDVAYLAGVIDGEGCVDTTWVTRWGTRTGQIRLTIRNTNKDLIDWVKDRFGGWSGCIKHSSQRHWKDAFYWACSSRRCAMILELVLPSLVVKKNQAALALAFQKTIAVHGGVRVPSDVQEKRQGICNAIKALNRKGKSESEVKSAAA